MTTGGAPGARGPLNSWTKLRVFKASSKKPSWFMSMVCKVSPLREHHGVVLVLRLALTNDGVARESHPVDFGGTVRCRIVLHQTRVERRGSGTIDALLVDIGHSQ